MKKEELIEGIWRILKKHGVDDGFSIHILSREIASQITIDEEKVIQLLLLHLQQSVGGENTIIADWIRNCFINKEKRNELAQALKKADIWKVEEPK